MRMLYNPNVKMQSVWYAWIEFKYSIKLDARTAATCPSCRLDFFVTSSKFFKYFIITYPLCFDEGLDNGASPNTSLKLNTCSCSCTEQSNTW